MCRLKRCERANAVFFWRMRADLLHTMIQIMFQAQIFKAIYKYQNIFYQILKIQKKNIAGRKYALYSYRAQIPPVCRTDAVLHCSIYHRDFDKKKIPPTILIFAFFIICFWISLVSLSIFFKTLFLYYINFIEAWYLWCIFIVRIYLKHSPHLIYAYLYENYANILKKKPHKFFPNPKNFTAIFTKMILQSVRYIFIQIISHIIAKIESKQN